MITIIKPVMSVVVPQHTLWIHLFFSSQDHQTLAYPKQKEVYQKSMLWHNNRHPQVAFLYRYHSVTELPGTK